MKAEVKKTIVIELAENEAFALMRFIEISMRELDKSGIAGPFFEKAQALLDRLDEAGI